MRVYSLSSEYDCILGFEDGGEMIDLTRAIDFYDLTMDGFVDTPIGIDELIMDDRFNVDFIGDVMDCVAKYGLEKDLVVTDEFYIDVPVMPGKIIALAPATPAKKSMPQESLSPAASGVNIWWYANTAIGITPMTKPIHTRRSMGCAIFHTRGTPPSVSPMKRLYMTQRWLTTSPFTVPASRTIDASAQMATMAITKMDRLRNLKVLSSLIARMKRG